MRRLYVALPLALVFAACAVDQQPDVDVSTEGIVRGKDEKKRPQVVAVHIRTYSGNVLCSGTYFAPRVVVTAAHCLKFANIPGQGFVYFGNDYLTDKAALPTIPPPGQPSVWARIETAATHPSYDATLNHPDIAFLHLDRELPFDPIPLYRQPVTPDLVNKGEIVGWGGSKALVADISQVEGAGIKRSALVKILGTPTEADYHPDDPNPGILDPAIRADLIKTDGMAPHANTCAGDSGGPLLIKVKGKDYLAGVSFWTGLFCEDYGMFTRIDPFLDVFDDAVRRAGKAPIVPRFECVLPQDDGSKLAYFGYNNDNALTVGIPYGPRNLFPKDRAGARPDAFAPGDNPFDFSVPLKAGDRLSWLLVPPGGPTTLLQADASSAACDPNDQTLICADQCHAALAAECADPGLDYGPCVRDCVSTALAFAYYGCGTQWNTFLRCSADVPPPAANWDCSFPGFPPTPAPPNCAAEINGLFCCLYGYYCN